MKNFEKSLFESNYLNLNVFRSVSTVLPEPDEIRKIAIANKADLLRIKFDVKHENIMNHILEQSGLPYYYSHSVINTYADYSRIPELTYKNNDIKFLEYKNPDDKERFFNIVYHGMFEDPIGYYKTPLISEIISKENELRCYASFYAENYIGKRENQIALIIQKSGVDVGSLVFELENGTISSSMVTILPEFRSIGLFHDINVFVRNEFIKEFEIKSAIGGSRITNFHTPNIMIKLGFKIFSAEHIFHIPALLSKSIIPAIETNADFPVQKIYEFIHDKLDSIDNIALQKFLKQNNFIVDTKLIPVTNSGFKSIRIQLPIISEKLIVSTVYLIDDNNQISYVVYYKLKSKNL